MGNDSKFVFCRLRFFDECEKLMEVDICQALEFLRYRTKECMHKTYLQYN